MLHDFECRLMCFTSLEWNIFLHHIGKWCGYGAEILYEPPVKTSESVKTPHLANSRRARPVLYSANLLVINLFTMRTNYKTKENNLVYAKGALSAYNFSYLRTSKTDCKCETGHAYSYFKSRNHQNTKLQIFQEMDAKHDSLNA